MKTRLSASERLRLVWLDFEMTGLDPNVNEILEAAIIITDGELKVIAEGPHLILRQAPETFATMDAWNQSHHTSSGLWEKALSSKTELRAAEDELLAFVSEHTKKGRGILSGNSIWQDRRFIHRYMPRLDTYLHYRMVDVSAIKTLAQVWYEGVAFKKKEAHRALDDVRESIAELSYYREACFKNKELPLNLV